MSAVATVDELEGHRIRAFVADAIGQVLPVAADCYAERILAP